MCWHRREQDRLEEGRDDWMEEYLNKLLEQIHCRQAREMVGEEIRNHILDQAQANEQTGMGKREALEEAVRDMGDPVEAGTALNRVHRPRTDWRMLVLIGIISILSAFVHAGIGIREESLGAVYGLRHGTVVFIGYMVMLAVYRMDYSYIGKYAKRIAALFWLGAVLHHFIGMEQNGMMRWVSLGTLGSVSVQELIYLYIPVYGALLYRYRGKGYRAAGTCVLWMLFPLLTLTLRMNCLSASMLLFFVLAAMFSTAVGKGWFEVRKKRVLAGFWAVFGLLPALGVAAAVFGNYLATYQTERIKALVGQGSSYYDYQRAQAAEYLKYSRLIGSSGEEMMNLPGIQNDYLLNFVANYYGMAVMLVISLLLLAVAARVIQVSFGQGNPLGMIMGCGCGLFFEIVTVIDILHFFGWIPSTRLFLPFFSAGGSGIAVAYVLAGIVLSVYRYQNVKGNLRSDFS